MNLNPTPDTMTASTPNVAPTRSRLNPLGWSRNLKITAAALGLSLAVGGWAAFRPEKLFINNTVSESFPTVAVGTRGAPVLLSQGGFKGLGHHTEGRASIFQQGERHILRLSNGFSTSNGPDVRVYLVEGSNGADNAAIKNGKYLDLGVIKGNIGDQNYVLPASFDPAKYASVSIWCKRFAVNFAAASLSTAPDASPSTSAALQAAPMESQMESQSRKPIVVTSGAFRQTTHATRGTATITEDSKGARTLSLSGFATSAGPKLRVYLYAAEQVKDNGAAKKLVQKKQFIDLGALKSTSGTQSYVVPKGIDLWKFLSVGIWCDQFDVQFGVAPLSAPAA
jgi:hypothetical protein